MQTWFLQPETAQNRTLTIRCDVCRICFGVGRKFIAHGPILPGCKVGDDDLGAVIEKGFCEGHWQSHQNRR